MDPKNLSARQLLELCLKTRDEALWVEFVRRFQPMITRVVARTICCRISRGDNRALVDDLAQNTFIKLCQNDFKALRSFVFQHENALYGFLKVVAIRVVEDHIRKGEGRNEEDLDEGQATKAKAREGPAAMERSILLEEIDRLLQKLAGEPNFKRDYTIFWLYYRDGLTAKAISELSEISLGVKGVESTLLRLIKWVRGRLH